MSRLTDAIYDEMAYIVYHESRPFSFHDFCKIGVDGELVYPAYGTLRNLFMRFRRQGKIEFNFNSGGIAFHSLPGHPFTKKTMTPDHTGVYRRKADILCDTISAQSRAKPALHDIRMRFKILGAWDILSQSGRFIPQPISRDIPLPQWNFDNREYMLTVHDTDTVSVIVACSDYPIVTDVRGIRRLTEDLTRVEERFARMLEDASTSLGRSFVVQIPRHAGWLVTMWHFGYDAKLELGGEKYHMALEAGMNGLERVYIKDMKDGKRVRRDELQQYPRETYEDATEEKLRYTYDTPEGLFIDMQS